jgi:hypothetical protein
VSAGSIRAELTQDQTTTAPDPDAPTLEHETSGQLRFDWQVAPPVELSLRTWAGNVGGAQVKWYALRPTGRDPFSLAVTLGIGRGNNDFDFNASTAEDSHTSVKQSLVDLGLVLGARAGGGLLVFGGPFASGNKYRGHYFSERGNDPDVEQDFEGRVDVLGANAGVAYYASHWFTLAAEISGGRVEAGNTKETAVTGTLMAHFWFGPRREGTPGEIVEPIEVVPVDSSGPTR